MNLITSNHLQQPLQSYQNSSKLLSNEVEPQNLQQKLCLGVQIPRDIPGMRKHSWYLLMLIPSSLWVTCCDPPPHHGKKYLYSTRMFYILLCVWINFGFCTTKSQSILFLELKCTFCSKFWVSNPMLFLSLTLKSAYVSKFCVWSCHFFSHNYPPVWLEDSPIYSTTCNIMVYHIM